MPERSAQHFARAAAAEAGGALLEVRGLTTHYFTDEGVVRAVDGVDFTLARGRTLCVVGESGSGKSVTARSILQLVDAPGRIVAGEILFRPKPGETIDITRLGSRGPGIRKIRGREIAMIFQEPMSSLSPVHSIGDQIAEAIVLHFGVSRREATERSIEMLRRVGIPKAASRFSAYPFQLSGGCASAP